MDSGVVFDTRVVDVVVGCFVVTGFAKRNIFS